MLSLTAAVDGQRLYVGGYAGVWRSDDGGTSWTQLKYQEPPPSDPANPVFSGNALREPIIIDLVVSPADRDLVLAGAVGDTRLPSLKQDGIYQSEDGGASWQLVHQFRCSGLVERVGQIVFSPDDPEIVYAAGGCAIAVSTDAGRTWEDLHAALGADSFDGAGGAVWHVAVGPQEGPTAGNRRVYALGNGAIWFSQDGGVSWSRDLGAVPFGPFGSGGEPLFESFAELSSARVLALEPGRPDQLYVAIPGLANGPSYYVKPRCGAPLDLPDGLECNTIPERGCG